MSRESDAEPRESDGKPREIDATPESDAKPREPVAKPRQSGAKPRETDAKPQAGFWLNFGYPSRCIWGRNMCVFYVTIAQNHILTPTLSSTQPLSQP